MVLEAVAPLVRNNLLRLDIVGDGPLMPDLRACVEEHGLEAGVTLHGWLSHPRVQSVMRESQLLLFPSIREFGGGVVLEAMALGIVPVVVDYGGPGELVTDATGFKIPLGTREEIIARLRHLVTSICNQTTPLSTKAALARSRVQNLFTWDVKADQIIEVYDWIKRGRTNTPRFFDCDRETPSV